MTSNDKIIVRACTIDVDIKPLLDTMGMLESPKRISEDIEGLIDTVLRDIELYQKNDLADEILPWLSTLTELKKAFRQMHIEG